MALTDATTWWSTMSLKEKMTWAAETYVLRDEDGNVLAEYPRNHEDDSEFVEWDFFCDGATKNAWKAYWQYIRETYK
jgi:hypothetical protein